MINLPSVHGRSGVKGVIRRLFGPRTSKYNVLWSEVRSLQAAGITVLGMLGGAVHRSFGVLDGDDTSFNHSYSPLREMLAATGLNGIDLDVEEPMCWPVQKRLWLKHHCDAGAGGYCFAKGKR